ncbi:uncharacterized protein LOC109544438 [Dendroctonus ponderosae]|uniref:uncharacterized protein LOC109544438 n=1 Tax=Dendroctonus ponderosae TaxID=77166 RepID=UPI002034C5CC|nr:uncharacterized protein LOC109544438 [Dendroctonus ponderosae]
MVISEVEEVFIRYRAQENKIDNILRNNDEAATKATDINFTNLQTQNISADEAKTRNTQILKELEFIKGNLRSKSIFSPTELHWEKVCEKYQNNPSLSVTTWHCHVPVFV